MRLSLLVALSLLPISVMAQGDLRTQTEATRALFEKGKDIGHVADNPKGAYRRLVQRTIMPTETPPWYGAVLTFDDQLVPMEPKDSSALQIARDLQKRKARAIFFANVPGVSSKSLYSIYRATSQLDSQKEKCLALLQKQKPLFIKTLRELLKMKHEGGYVCDVFNHTAFHQDMRRFKVGSRQMELCIVGIRFIEDCLDEAYLAERPDYLRPRYFRFPFLHTPRDAKARKALNKLFIELGLIALGETQDSKDFDNGSAKIARASLLAAQKHQRYSVSMGPYGQTDQPIALFHTKTWGKIKSGVLKVIDDTPIPIPPPVTVVAVPADPFADTTSAEEPVLGPILPAGNQALPTGLPDPVLPDPPEKDD